MTSRPQTAKVVSSFEQKFRKQQIFKRNKRYINTDVNQNSFQSSILNRIPFASDHNSMLHSKFRSSFTNSTAQFSNRQINKSKTKVSSSTRFQDYSKDEEVKVEEENPQESIKSFSIQKMTSREYHHKIKNKPCQDQRLFNNFQPFSPSNQPVPNFENMKGKILDNSIPHIQDLQYNTQKLYQSFYFPHASTDCKVDYKSQKKQRRGRKFFNSTRPENQPSTQLDWQVVDKGAKISTHFKSSNISKSNVIQFYRGQDKNRPSQTDMRFMNNLTNQWVNQNGVIEKKKLDYTMRKMKEDLKNDRIEKIKESKKAKIKRSEMCEAKFFSYRKK